MEEYQRQFKGPGQQASELQSWDEAISPRSYESSLVWTSKAKDGQRVQLEGHPLKYENVPRSFWLMKSLKKMQ